MDWQGQNLMTLLMQPVCFVVASFIIAYDALTSLLATALVNFPDWSFSNRHHPSETSKHPKPQVASPRSNNNATNIRGKGDICETEGAVDAIVPSIGRVHEELSCAICLEMCFQPITIPCGHSFCKSCLQSAVDRCGKKCPKCRQFISNLPSCAINTSLWNIIQLLFPKEVEERKTRALNRRTTRGVALNTTRSQARQRWCI